jgi:SURF4 family
MDDEQHISSFTSTNPGSIPQEPMAIVLEDRLELRDAYSSSHSLPSWSHFLSPWYIEELHGFCMQAMRHLKPHLPVISRFMTVAYFLKTALNILIRWGDGLLYLRR